MDQLFLQHATGVLAGVGFTLGVVSMKYDAVPQKGLWLISLSAIAMVLAAALRIVEANRKGSKS